LLVVPSGRLPKAIRDARLSRGAQSGPRLRPLAASVTLTRPKWQRAARAECGEQRERLVGELHLLCVDVRP
jgi:hypothetical protein